MYFSNFNQDHLLSEAILMGYFMSILQGPVF